MSSKDRIDTIDTIGFGGVLLGVGAPSENPLTKAEVDAFIELTKNRDAKMFATGHLHALVAANNGAPIRAERLREVHQATLDYLKTLEYTIVYNNGRSIFDNE